MMDKGTRIKLYAPTSSGGGIQTMDQAYSWNKDRKIKLNITFPNQFDQYYIP